MKTDQEYVQYKKVNYAFTKQTCMCYDAWLLNKLQNVTEYYSTRNKVPVSIKY